MLQIHNIYNPKYIYIRILRKYQKFPFHAHINHEDYASLHLR